MITLLANSYKVSPPFNIRHNDPDPFSRPVCGSKDARRVCKNLGLLHTDRQFADVWLYVKKHAEPHRDHGGKCAIYLHSGAGTLYVVPVKGPMTYLRMHAGSVALFNDRIRHFWLSQTPCTMLVFNVRVPKDYKAPCEDYWDTSVLRHLEPWTV